MLSNKTWGEIFGMLATVASLPVAIACGAIGAACGEGFDRTANEIMDGAFKLGEDFGEEHGKTVEKKLVRMAVQATVMTVTGVLVDGVIDPTTPGADPPKDTPS